MSAAPPRCPSCGAAPGSLLFDARAIADEIAARRSFFLARLSGRATRDQLRDSVDVFLGTPADILRCERCGILVRADAPPDDAFRDDPYGSALLRALHEAHVAAFRAKRGEYGSLLAPRARVVEIGSYAGGFLRAATEWRWQATGVDIGYDTSRFTAALGFDTRGVFDARAFGGRSIDALFVWNCFEQISQPRQLLAAAHDALRDGGLLVLRVPDADFYLGRRDLRLLGYNGLLGWPHRFGFGAAALRRLAAEQGFALKRILRRPPLEPLAEMSAAAREEQSALFTADNCGWIELTFRKSGAFAAAA